MTETEHPTMGKGFSTHEPACDQCRLKKSKCDRRSPQCGSCMRGGLQCIYSERAKRSNQTKKLILDIGELATRLERLEGAVERCTTALTTLLDRSTKSSNPTSDGEGSCERDNDELQIAHSMQYGQPTIGDDQNMDAAIYDNNDAAHQDELKGCHRATATASLFSNIQHRIEKWLTNISQSNDPKEGHMYNEMLKLNQIWIDQFTNNQLMAIDLPNDGLPPNPPSKELLDSLTDLYFRQVNTVLPILSRKQFYKNLENMPNLQHDSAWIVICNSLTIQSLYQVVRLATQNSEQSLPITMDKEVVLPFLENSRRAFGQVQSLRTPRLLNVQAVTSLFLIAMDHFQMEVAELLFEQACQLALEAGLHLENDGTMVYTPEEIKERRGLFWTLYILDKNLSLVKGRSHYISLQGSSIPLPASNGTNSESTLERFFLARIRLAMIQEQVFLKLYSANEIKRQQQSVNSITVLDSLLRHWYDEHKALLDKAFLNGSHSALSLEILFHYQNTRILVLRCFDEISYQAACVGPCRESLMLLQNLNQSRGVGRNSSLLRALQLVPFAAFTELVHHILKSLGQYDATPSVEPDLDLLANSVEIMKSITSYDSQTTYSYKLYQTTSQCLEIVTNIIRHTQPWPTLALSNESQWSTPGNKQKPDLQMFKPQESINSIELYDMFVDFDMSYDALNQTIGLPTSASTLFPSM